VAAEDESMPFLDLLNRQSLGLPWGSTVVIITPQEAEGLMNTLLALRRRGLAIVLVLTCPERGFHLTAERAEQIGVRALQVRTERDLDVWR
jgi:hypothetical protein